MSASPHAGTCAGWSVYECVCLKQSVSVVVCPWGAEHVITGSNLMREWNIHELHVALKTKLGASPKVSNGHAYGYKSGLAFNKMKYSTCINIKYFMNVTEEFHFKMRLLPFKKRGIYLCRATPRMKSKTHYWISFVLRKMKYKPRITATNLKYKIKPRQTYV